jgi:4-hydroxybenzoyl-CoA thioesterase
MSADRPEAGGVHVMQVAVRWGHCDPAGIVYFPRFFDMFHDAMETWFSACLQVPYSDVIVGRKLGFPSVHTEADFERPTTFGETVAVELRVESLGRSSIRLGYLVRELEDPTRVRARGATVCVVMDLDPQRPTYQQAVPIPPELRSRIEAFMRGG